MARYIAYRGKRVILVSHKPITSTVDTVLEVPASLQYLSDIDLLDRGRIKEGALYDSGARKKSSDLRLAFVGVWREPCGISTYAEQLWPEVAKQIKDYRVFAEHFDAPPEDKVVRCWRRGESLTELVEQIKAYDPDAVLIQHEFGIWPNARHYLSLLSRLKDYRVIVTMHSIFRHRDKTICEAATPEIIVHTELARKVLKEEKKIPGKVHVLPHGCEPCQRPEKYWNMYKSNHTFVQFGFGFRYKNWEMPLDATSLLKDRYPDVFFTGLFSEGMYSKREHDLYMAELEERTEKLGISENVALIRGFQSDETLDSYLRTNQIAVFPYVNDEEHMVFGCSGAARVAMTAGLPVIVSRVPHFYDLEGFVPKASNAKELAEHLETMFKNPKRMREQVESQNRFLTDNSWQVIAHKLCQLLTS